MTKNKRPHTEDKRPDTIDTFRQSSLPEGFRLVRCRPVQAPGPGLKEESCCRLSREPESPKSATGRRPPRLLPSLPGILNTFATWRPLCLAASILLAAVPAYCLFASQVIRSLLPMRSLKKIPCEVSGSWELVPPHNNKDQKPCSGEIRAQHRYLSSVLRT